MKYSENTCAEYSLGISPPRFLRKFFQSAISFRALLFIPLVHQSYDVPIPLSVNLRKAHAFEVEFSLPHASRLRPGLDGIDPQHPIWALGQVGEKFSRRQIYLGVQAILGSTADDVTPPL